MAKILVAGDFCPAGRPEPVLLDWESAGIWEDIARETSSHDLRIVNLESPLTRSKTPLVKSGPHLSANPGCAKAIRGANFDLVTLANNHIMDMGGSGLKETMEACRSAGLRTVGAGDNLAEAAQPVYADVNGLRIAVLAITEHEHSIATERRAGACPLEPMDNYSQIGEAREQSGFVLVVLHGGNEYYPLPSPRVVRTCRFLVDAGANAVVCHHTHVSSGIEIYHDAPIIYSTGNFLFGASGTAAPEWFEGYLVSISIRPGGATGLRLIPYRQCLEGVGVRLMDEDESRSFLGEISRLSGIISESDALLLQWSRFCASRREDYVSHVLALSRVERKLCKMTGIWPFWRMNRKDIPVLLDMFQCESHRDVCIEILASGRAE